MHLLSYLSLFGYGLFMSRNKEIPILAIPSLCCCLIVNTLFLAGTLGILDIGLNLIIWLGLLLIPISLTSSSSRNNSIRLFALYASILLLGNILIRSTHSFWITDEFTHWGLATKSLVLERHLWDASSPVFAKSYPPGNSLFHFFVVAYEQWSEAQINRAHFFFVVSALLATLGWTLKTASGKVIAFALSFTVPLALGLSYGVIMPDVLIGFLFAVAISIATSQSIGKKTKLWSVSGTTVSIVLLKDTGILLAFIVSFLVLVTLWHSSAEVPKRIRRVLPSTVLVVCAALIPQIIWQLRLRIYDISGPANVLATKAVATVSAATQVESPGDSVSNFEMDSFSEPTVLDNETFKAVLAKLNQPDYPKINIFPKFLFDIPTPSLSLLQVAALLFSINVLLIKLQQGRPLRSLVWQQVAVWIGAVGYLVIHGFLLTILLPEFEAQQAAGLERYLAVYLIAQIIVTICGLIGMAELRLKSGGSVVLSNWLPTIFAVIAIGFFYALVSQYKSTPQPVQRLKAIEEIKLTATVLKTVIGENDSVYFLYNEPAYMSLCQYNCGVSGYYVFRLEMSPNVRLSRACGSYLVPSPVDGDCLADFDNTIGEFDFLALMNVDKRALSISKKFRQIQLGQQTFQIFEVLKEPYSKNGFPSLRLVTQSRRS